MGSGSISDPIEVGSTQSRLSIFCTVSEVESETPHVKFPGWCPVSIIDQREPKWTGYATRRIHNYQIDESELKPVEEMAKLAL
jgi:hypothetical protein